jgi:mannose-6-phosphate isomerase
MYAGGRHPDLVYLLNDVTDSKAFRQNYSLARLLETAMSLIQLKSRPVARVWGRTSLPAWAGQQEPQADPIGELWVEDERGDQAELLVKFLFTSERLSIQVHPDDRAARAHGHPRGKDEAWLILDADAGAEIGVGLKSTLSEEGLRSAALDGTLERLIDWRPVRAGDFIYAPAGTIHAIGGGVSLIEIQQNSDVTYRLYDYGRPRELHLNDGVAVSRPEPFPEQAQRLSAAAGREILASGRVFTIEHWRGPLSCSVSNDGEPLTLIPLGGDVRFADRRLKLGSVWTTDAPGSIEMGADAALLVAYPRPNAIPDLLG